MNAHAFATKHGSGREAALGGRKKAADAAAALPAGLIERGWRSGKVGGDAAD